MPKQVYPPAIQRLLDKSHELYQAKNLILNCVERWPPERIFQIAAYIRAMDEWAIDPVVCTSDEQSG